MMAVLVLLASSPLPCRHLHLSPATVGTVSCLIRSHNPKDMRALSRPRGDLRRATQQMMPIVKESVCRVSGEGMKHQVRSAHTTSSVQPDARERCGSNHLYHPEASKCERRTWTITVLEFQSAWCSSSSRV